jgi:hypothetical protein
MTTRKIVQKDNHVMFDCFYNFILGVHAVTARANRDCHGNLYWLLVIHFVRVAAGTSITLCSFTNRCSSAPRDLEIFPIIRRSNPSSDKKLSILCSLNLLATTRKIAQLFGEVCAPKLGCFKLNLVSKNDKKQSVCSVEASNEYS